MRLILALSVLLAGPVAAQTPLAVGRPAAERAIAAGEEHTYTATIEAGYEARFVVEQRGVDVVVHVVGPQGDTLARVDSPNGDQGPEPAAVTAATTGLYRLVVRPFDAHAGDGIYEARLDAVLTAAQVAAEAQALQATRDSVVAWIASRAVPIRSVTAGSGVDDLQPLRDVLASARIVGMGEATHGTREFFQFKHRMLEFLVREMGFRVFAIEASLSAAETVINPWVQGGPGQVDAVLASQGFWTWDTEEVRDLLVWMRAYNASVSPGDRVRFVGIDIQVNDEARRTLLDVLRRAAPDRVPDAEALFAADLDSLAYVPFGTPDSTALAEAMAELSRLDTGYAALAADVAAREPALAAATSPAEAAQAVRYARTLAQHVHSYSQTSEAEGIRLRDLYMAENLRRFLDAEPPGTRVALWAHNGHVSTDTTNWMGAWLGGHLRHYYGDAYYALGFAFGRGAFQARDGGSTAGNALTEFTLGLAPPETADGTFDEVAERTGAPALFVDFRAPADVPAARHWLTEPHGSFQTGSSYSAGGLAYPPVVLPDAFDGLVFIRETTRARPMPGVRNVAGR